MKKGSWKNLFKLGKEPIIQALFLFILIFTLFLWFGSTTSFPDPDSFYHAKMASLLSQGEFSQTLPWQQFTVLKDYGVDQHFLWHLFLVPFSLLAFPFGIKFSVVILASVLLVLIFWFFKKLKTPYAFWLTLLLATITPWTFRINLVKANTTSLIFLILGLYFIFKKDKKKFDYIVFFILCFFYVWAYGGFILLLFFVLLYWLVDSIYQAIKKPTQAHTFFQWLSDNLKLFFKEVFKKSRLYFGLTALGGMLAGIIINPFFPKNLYYWWDQVVQIGIVNYQEKIGVGGEWYPYPILDLTTGSVTLAIVFLFALSLFLYKIKKQSAVTWTMFLLAIFFVAWNMRSRRYVEYSVPFVALFTGLSLRDSFVGYQFKNFIVDIKKFLKNNFNKIVVFVLIVFVIITFVVISVKEQQSTKRDLGGSIAFDKFEKSMIWLENNSNQGDIVLHSDWDEWPLLFYYNHHNYYIVGLDPTFMYKYDEDLYWQWVNITIGKQKTDLCDIIPNNFNAHWVFLETDHTGMDANIVNSGCFDLQYEDTQAKIYKLNESI